MRGQICMTSEYGFCAKVLIMGAESHSGAYEWIIMWLEIEQAVNRCDEVQISQKLMTASGNAEKYW